MTHELDLLYSFLADLCNFSLLAAKATYALFSNAHGKLLLKNSFWIHQDLFLDTLGKVEHDAICTKLKRVLASFHETCSVSSISFTLLCDRLQRDPPSKLVVYSF